MTTDETTPDSNEKPRGWSCGTWSMIATGVLAFGFGTLALPPLDALFLPVYHFLWCLLVGWIGFLADVLPSVSVHLGTLLLGVGSAAVFAVLCHALAGWLKQEGAAETPWKWEWTFACTSLLVVVFAAGTAMIGVVHQVGWLLAEGRFVEDRGGGRPAAKRSMSKSNLKQIGIAFHNHHDTREALPRGIEYDDTGQPMHSWATHLLPLLEQGRVHERIDFDQPWDADANRESISTAIVVFRSPGVEDQDIDDRGYPTAHYAGNVRLFPARTPLRLRDVTDGLANTILAGEVSRKVVAWGNPLNLRDPAIGINATADGFGGPWTNGGTVVLMADGSVQFVTPTIDPHILRALSTPAGGESVAPPWER